MADNPYVNKVVFGSTTLLDLTSDTVTAGDLTIGVTAHDRSGAPIVGTMPIPSDYIIEHYVAQGSNEWNWCKWASGKSEAWKNYDLYVGGWTSWGSMYESNQYANSLAFPSGLFIETPAPDLRLRYSDGGYALAGFENAGGGSASQSHNLYLLRPTSASATTWHLFIYYLGRWQ